AESKVLKKVIGDLPNDHTELDEVLIMCVLLTIEDPLEEGIVFVYIHFLLDGGFEAAIHQHLYYFSNLHVGHLRSCHILYRLYYIYFSVFKKRKMEKIRLRLLYLLLLPLGYSFLVLQVFSLGQVQGAPPASRPRFHLR